MLSMDLTSLVIKKLTIFDVIMWKSRKPSPKCHPRNMGSKVNIHLHP